MGSDQRPPNVKKRVFVCIDGFNLYYGIKAASRDSDTFHLRHGGEEADCLGRSLYWLDLQALALSQMHWTQECCRIKYFSAPRRIPRLVTVDPAPFIESNERQRVFLEAVRTLPLVETVLGWYSERTPYRCPCGIERFRFEEKTTDVNIATHMLCDAYENRFDEAVVMSADADLVSPVEAVQRLGKPVTVLLSPGRRQAEHLRQVASQTRNMKIKTMRKYPLPDEIDRAGFPPIRRPDHWRKPGRWIWTDSTPGSN